MKGRSVVTLDHRIHTEPEGETQSETQDQGFDPESW